MADWLKRAIKTFIQAFFGVLIPQVVIWLNNASEIVWSEWQVWLLPVICAALAAGISAVWNIIKEHNEH